MTKHDLVLKTIITQTDNLCVFVLKTIITHYQPRPAIIATSLGTRYWACFIHSVLADNSTCRKYIELGMAFSRLELKIISIIQLVMSVILFALGIVDHFEVRYIYLSQLLMPCWIAALVRTHAQDIELRVFYCLRSCF